MKNLLRCLMGVLVMCASASCEHENETVERAKFRNKGLYHGAWLEWGRAARGCDGWGLCAYRDCWNCSADDVKYYAVIDFDSETGEGHMTIELDPSEDIQAQAIQQHLPFSVDNEIPNENSILHAGQYPFNPEVGEHGGYILNITVTNP